jgi:hypothetical protein
MSAICLFYEQARFTLMNEIRDMQVDGTDTPRRLAGPGAAAAFKSPARKFSIPIV